MVTRQRSAGAYTTQLCLLSSCVKSLCAVTSQISLASSAGPCWVWPPSNQIREGILRLRPPAQRLHRPSRRPYCRVIAPLAIAPSPGSPTSKACPSLSRTLMPGTSTLAAPQASAAAPPGLARGGGLAGLLQDARGPNEVHRQRGRRSRWSVALRALEENECVILFVSASRDNTDSLVDLVCSRELLKAVADRA